jgi:DnaJ-class molecular chaperone
MAGKTCGKCGGKGWVARIVGDKMGVKRCPACGGSGRKRHV